MRERQHATWGFALASSRDCPDEGLFRRQVVFFGHFTGEDRPTPPS